MDLNQLGVPGIWQAAKSKSKNLIVILHGRGDSPAGFEWFQNALGIDDLNFLLLQAPDPYFSGFSWYDLPPNQGPGIIRSQEFLTNIFSRLPELGFPPERCLLFGFSQGCLMTLEFGLRFPKSLAGYIGISGYAFDVQALKREANPAVRRGNWLITHGSLDEVLPIERTRDQIQDLIRSEFKIEYREYSKSHTIDETDELPMLRKWIRKRIGEMNL